MKIEYTEPFILKVLILILAAVLTGSYCYGCIYSNTERVFQIKNDIVYGSSIASGEREMFEDNGKERKKLDIKSIVSGGVEYSSTPILSVDKSGVYGWKSRLSGSVEVVDSNLEHKALFDTGHGMVRDVVYSVHTNEYCVSYQEFGGGSQTIFLGSSMLLYSWGDSVLRHSLYFDDQVVIVYVDEIGVQLLDRKTLDRYLILPDPEREIEWFEYAGGYLYISKRTDNGSGQLEQFKLITNEAVFNNVVSSVKWLFLDRYEEWLLVADHSGIPILVQGSTGKSYPVDTLQDYEYGAGALHLNRVSSTGGGVDVSLSFYNKGSFHNMMKSIMID